MESRLPPLNAIRTFEAAARHLSFARAAEELGVTQSAVSKQISLLEDFIGGQLFERQPGGVALTFEGRELKQSITPAFEILGTSFQRYSRRAPRSNRFRLSTVASFASQFLVPRLDDFEARFPDIMLEILTSDRVLDLTREEIDLSIRYGKGDWDGLVSRRLTPGDLVPVCAPDMMKQHSGDVTRLITDNRRIQVFSYDEWRVWSDETGIDLPATPPAFVMEHFLVALQAVLTGQGVALLPEVLVRTHLADSNMKQFSEMVPWEETFYLVHLPNAEKRPAIRDVVTWLEQQSAPAGQTA